MNPLLLPLGQLAELLLIFMGGIQIHNHNISFGGIEGGRRLRLLTGLENIKFTVDYTSFCCENPATPIPFPQHTPNANTQHTHTHTTAFKIAPSNNYQVTPRFNANPKSLKRVRVPLGTVYID